MIKDTVDFPHESAAAVSPVVGLSRQVAALPVRFTADGRSQILMITTRRNRKWIVPKGWHIPGLSPHDAAAREAFEEAGVRGTVLSRPVGSYAFCKTRRERPDLDCQVDVYLLYVREELNDWPERAGRQRLWCDVADAAERAGHEGLGTLIAQIAPKLAQIGGG